MWHVTCLGGLRFSQSFSSLALTVCDLWYHEDREEKDQWLNELINDEVVYRTAPGTPGLLNIRSCEGRGHKTLDFSQCGSFFHCLFDHKNEVDHELWGCILYQWLVVSGQCYQWGYSLYFQPVWSLQTPTYLFYFDLLWGEYLAGYLDGPGSVIVNVHCRYTLK